MYPHRIRLRGPWEYELESAGSPTRGRASFPWVPDSTPFSGFAGRVCFRRRFGLPRQIDDHERVWLTIQGLALAASISLNGRRLECSAVDAEFDVTSELRERNELLVEMEIDAQPRPPWEEIALEIRCTAFLRKVRIGVRLHDGVTILEAVGDVVCTREEALELYLILDRMNVAYTPVIGGEFRLHAQDLEIDWIQPHSARVELVAGGVVYDEYEQITLSANPAT